MTKKNSDKVSNASRKIFKTFFSSRWNVKNKTFVLKIVKLHHPRDCQHIQSNYRKRTCQSLARNSFCKLILANKESQKLETDQEKRHAKFYQFLATLFSPRPCRCPSKTPTKLTAFDLLALGRRCPAGLSTNHKSCMINLCIRESEL